MASKPTELKRYKFYNWGDSDHDPIIDQMRTLMQDEHLSYAKLAELTGLSPTTIKNWFDRKITKTHKPTMRPMFSSVMTYTRGLGYDLRIVKPERRVAASTGVVFQRNVAAKSNVGANLTH